MVWRCQTNWFVQRLRLGTGSFTRPIAFGLVAGIRLALNYSFKPKPWEGEAGKSND